MLAIAPDFLKALDWTLQGIGGLCALGFVFWLWRRERWQNPLRGTQPVRVGPNVFHVLAILGLYAATAVITGYFLTYHLDRKDAAVPGTHAWHVVITVDMIAKLVSAGAVLVVLGAHNSLAPPQPRNPLRILPVALVGVLIAVPMTSVLATMTTEVWERLNPQSTPPVHAVLVALRQSEWGGTGALQLVLSACVAAPVAEELFFRGLLLQTMWRYFGHLWLSITVTALAFGYVHQAQPQDILPMTALGLLTGFVRVRYRSLSACILLHALFNGRTMFIAIAAPELLPP